MTQSKEPAKTVEKATVVSKDLKAEMHELNQKIKQSSENYTKALEAMKVYTNESFRGLNQMIVETARLNIDIQQLSQTHKDGYEYLKQTHKEAIEANNKELETLSKNINKQEEYIKAREERAILIVKTGLLAKAEMEEEYRLLESSLINNEKHEELVIALRKERDEKIAVISEDTLKQTIQNGAEMQRALELQTKATIDKVIEHSDEIIKHTSGVWSGVIDVNGQKKHLRDIEKQYVDYIFELKNFGKKRLEEYNEQLLNLNLSVDERATIMAQQKAFEAQHNKFLTEESKRIGTELAKIEKSGQHLRLTQWQQYAQNVSAISKQVSEVSSMVANSVGGMFNQLAQSYAQEVEELSGKIAAIDEEKEAALERVALTEEERRAKEEELANEKMNQELATTAEQYANAEERIAILQGELSAEETVNQEYAEKKAELEEEKAKKEKVQKKAEQMEKRLRMGQSIVEAIGNVAAGVAQALAHGPILGPILAAIVSAAGAVQVGIMTKQLSKMEDGGLLRGKRHAQGGMRIAGSNIEVEGGEYVINRHTTQKNLGLMDYINAQRRELTPADLHSYFNSPSIMPSLVSPIHSQIMERGGVIPTLPMEVDINTQQVLQAIGNINFQPRVSVTDIHHAEQQMARVDEWVGM